MMRNTSLMFGIVVLGAAVFAGLYFFRGSPRGSEAPIQYRHIPEITLVDYDGKEITLASYSGTPLLINAWASWCPFCKDEMPAFISLQQEFGDRIRVIVVNRGESLETAKKYSDELGLAGKLVTLLDPYDSLYKGIGGFSMPETIFVDRDGLIRFHKRGPMDYTEMKRRVEDLIPQ